MSKIRTFYHFSKQIEKIKKSEYVLNNSLARTYTFDWVIEFLRDKFLSTTGSKKFEEYASENKGTILKLKNLQLFEDYDFTAYPDIEFEFINPLLSDFFNNDGYILAFSQMFEKGWVSNDEGDKYVSSIFQKVGTQYLKFALKEDEISRVFVLEQKFWRKSHFEPIFKKEFGPNWEEYSKAFRKDVFENEKCSLLNYDQFKKRFIEELFLNYYDSITLLENYNDNFEVPEFWIGLKMPVSRCEFGEIDKVELEKKLGFKISKR